jgi:hypothetical protein
MHKSISLIGRDVSRKNLTKCALKPSPEGRTHSRSGEIVTQFDCIFLFGLVSLVISAFFFPFLYML